MVDVLKNRVHVQASSAGTGDLSLGAAISAAYLSFAAAGYADGNTFPYTAYTATQFECGHASYVAAGPTLDRTAANVVAGSAGAGALVNFSVPPRVFVGPLAETIDAKQPLDATLTALAGLSATAGLLEQTGADTFAKRALGVANAADVLTRADGDGRYAALADAFSNEKVDDRVAALIQNGTGISWSYNDGANTLTPTISLTPFSTTNLAEGGNLYYTDERVDDRVAALIQNGTGISWSYNDASGTLTPTVSLSPFSTTNLAEGSNLYYTSARVNAETQVTNKVLKAGDTMTGDLTIGKATPSIHLNRPAAGTTAGVFGYTNSLLRWSLIIANSTAEGGSDAGSNFQLIRHNDAGTQIDIPFQINRASGQINTTGLLVLGSGQLSFPATQNPSAGANVLDDYEESNSFTPALSFTTPGTLSVTYSVQTGSYTKIGRKVTATVTIVTSGFTLGTASGNLLVTGLPFASQNVSNIFYFGALSWSGITKANYTDIVARLDPNTTTVVFRASGSAQAAAFVTATDTPTGGTIILGFTLVYFTT